MINEEHKSSVTDLSLRRVRAKLTYKPTEKLLLVLQIGPTSVNFNSKSNTYMDLLDAYAEYKFSEHLSIGGGKSSWKGLNRFSSGPMETLLYDMPNFAYANTGVLDQVFRNMNVYAKGQFGKFDYRLVVAQPNPTVTSDPQYNRAVFNKLAPKKDFSGYFRYAFKETESNFTPFNAGTYVGKKEVLSLGVGFEHMKDALWHLNGDDQIKKDAMTNLAVDLFYDVPLSKDRGTSFSAYAMAMHSDYGANYLQMGPTNNPANGLDASQASLNGSGNGMPLAGTGTTLYAQVGGTLPYFNKEKSTLQLQPAVAVQYSQYDALHDKAVIYDASVSLLFRGMSSRLSLNAQNRPVFDVNAANQAVQSDRKWSFVLKYRIDIL